MSQPALSDWLARKPAGKKPRVAISRVSAKRSKDEQAYHVARKAFLLSKPFCQACEAFGNEVQFATECHHKHGRGKFYLDQSTWLAVCSPCHREIHRRPGTARKLQLLA